MARARRGRGEGSVFQRKDGRWVGRISLGYGGDGKRRQREVTGATKREALEKLAKLQQSALAGTLQEPNRLTVSQYLELWLKTSATDRVAPTTLARYRSLVSNHIGPMIGGGRLSALRAANLRQFYAELRERGRSDRTLQLCHAVLHRALKLAEREGLVSRNPAALIEPPRYRARKIEPLNSDQVQALLRSAAGDRLEALFVLAVTTGLRQGELFGLHWRDVDLQAGTLTVRYTVEELKGQLRLKEPKTAAGLRSVSLPDIAVQALHSHRARMLKEGLAGADIVFCDQQGGYLRRPNMERRHWQPIRKAASLPDSVRFHDLRHSAATMLLSAGVHPKIVQERLGHADIAVTMNTYSHVLPEMDREAAGHMDRLLRPAAGE